MRCEEVRVLEADTRVELEQDIVRLIESVKRYNIQTSTTYSYVEASAHPYKATLLLEYEVGHAI